MRPGNKVQVEQVWASQGSHGPPLKHWFSGYTLVSVDGDKAVVEVTREGFDKGCRLNFRASDVRPDESLTPP